MKPYYRPSYGENFNSIRSFLRSTQPIKDSEADFAKSRYGPLCTKLWRELNPNLSVQPPLQGAQVHKIWSRSNIFYDHFWLNNRVLSAIFSSFCSFLSHCASTVGPTLVYHTSKLREIIQKQKSVEVACC